MIRHQLPAYSPVSGRAALLATGQLLGLGDDPRPALRALLEREYDASTVMLCGSGTQALTIAIQEARRRVDPDAPVALPAFSCFDVASAAVGADVRVSLYDIGPDTLAPDLESLEQVLRAGAAVVVVTPLYGIPIDWLPIALLADRYGAILIEDAAQGNGASLNGRRLGTLAPISTLSFGRGKGWTGGNGGAVLIRDNKSPMRMTLSESAMPRRAVVVAAVAAQWALARPTIYGIPASLPALRLGQTTYIPPRSVKSLTRSAAATLVETYEASQREAESRQANALELLATIAENSRVRAIHAPNDSTAGYLRLPIRLANGIKAIQDERRALALGIARSYPRSLADLQQLAIRFDGPQRVDNGARTLVRELLTLPTHSRLRWREIGEIGKIIREL